MRKIGRRADAHASDDCRFLGHRARWRFDSSAGWRNWRLGMIFGIKGAGVEAGMIFFVFLCGIFRAILVWTRGIASMHFGLI